MDKEYKLPKGLWLAKGQEDFIKKELNITEWSDLKPEMMNTVFEILKSNPKLNKKVVMAILANIPQMQITTEQTVGIMEEAINAIKELAGNTQKIYASQIDKLYELLENKNFTQEDRNQIFSIIREVNQEIANTGRIAQESMFKLAEKLGKTAIVCAFLGLCGYAIEKNYKKPSNEVYNNDAYNNDIDMDEIGDD